MTANPLSCCAGYFTLEEIERTNACQKAGQMGDRICAGLKELVKKHGLPFVVWNTGSICHLETVGTMHYQIKLEETVGNPGNSRRDRRKTEGNGAYGRSYMAEGLVTLAGSRLYTSAAYTPKMIDQALACFDRVFENVAVKAD